MIVNIEYKNIRMKQASYNLIIIYNPCSYSCRTVSGLSIFIWQTLWLVMN